MSRISDVEAAAGTPSGTHVAALLPATAPPPEPARRVGFFKALLLYWLFPRRLGPHLAVARWRGALLAHVLSLLAVAGIIVAVRLVDTDGPTFPREPLTFEWQKLRVAAAGHILRMAANSSTGGYQIWLELAALVAIPLLEVGLVFGAILLMPWCAGGDRARSVFRRSLKNACWTTTSLIPPAIAFAFARLAVPDEYNWLYHTSNLSIVALQVAVLAVPLLLTLRCLLVGAGRYVGPPDGPAFAPREPVCDRCGYLIVGLPMASNCPECGWAVRHSLPGGWRRPTAWQAHEREPRGMVELIRLQRGVHRREFFDKLPVQEGMGAARHFWWGTWLLMVLAPLAFVRAGGSLGLWGTNTPIMAPAGLLAVVTPFLAQSLLMFAACLWGQAAYGIRDYRVSAVVCYYLSPVLWPLVAVVMAWTVLWNPDISERVYEVAVGPAWLPLSAPMAVGALLAMAAGLVLLRWWWHACRALAAVRFANV